MSDTSGGTKAPWILSNGMTGKFNHMYIRQLAKKTLNDPRDFDLTSYQWVAECGVCHPGGGIMERDRDGHQYDVRQMTDTELAELLDGDYYGARWNESGVIEADCLICHLSEGYDYGIRVEQIKKLNYRWAGTAAAGLGGIVGSVSEGNIPSVVYNLRLFNADGKVKLPITRPEDRRCLHCHDEASMKSRGVTWHDHFNQDVHTQSGIRCTECHPGDMDHNFAKGTSRELTVRDDLDGTMRSCKQCHTEGALGAPKMVHRGLPAFHLDTIACSACHIPSEQIVALSVPDMSTGAIVHLPNVPGAKKYGEVAQWLPTYEIGEDGLIYPYNNILPVWWGHKEELKTDQKTEWIIYPLFLKEVKPAYEKLNAKFEKDFKEGKLVGITTENELSETLATINTESEISVMLAALKEVETRFANIRPVYVKGNRVYEIGPDGKLTSYADPAAEPIHWALSHNVSGREHALGYKGCTDCHAPNSHFFFGAATVDPFGQDGKPVTVPMYQLMGFSQLGLLLAAWREGQLKPAAPWIVLAVVCIMLLHFSLFGSRNRNKEEYVPDVVRFRVHERVTHLVLMLSVTFLMVTGFFFLLGKRDPLDPWARQTHPIVGFIAIAAVLAILLYWAREMPAAAGDAEWIRGLGGYFGGDKKLPAGKFNAGQKIFFWIAVLLGIVLALTGILMYIYRGTRYPLLQLLYTAHDLAALSMLLTILGHVYLGVFVNPHTLKTLFGGKVSSIWAKEHHPNWKFPTDPSQTVDGRQNTESS